MSHDLIFTSSVLTRTNFSPITLQGLLAKRSWLAFIDVELYLLLIITCFYTDDVSYLLYHTKIITDSLAIPFERNLNMNYQNLMHVTLSLTSFYICSQKSLINTSLWKNQEQIKEVSWLKSWTLSKKCLYSEFFWSIFSLICTEYGDIFLRMNYSIRWKVSLS